MSLRPALALILLAAGTSQAADLQACRRLTDAEQRLACYDKAALDEADKAAAAPPAALPATLPAAPPAAAERSERQPAPLAATFPPAPPPPGNGCPPAERPVSALGHAWELDCSERGRILQIRPYKPVYALPYFHASQVNDMPASPSPGHTVGSPQGISADEAKLQLSLKTKLGEDLFGDNGDLWFGYTQTSRWQVFNGEISRPFRETNYEPELMLVWRTDYEIAGWRGRFFNLALNHESNGRSLPLSRSWNRLMLAANFERGDWTLSLRPWWRLPESAANDDNPDIADYLGRGDLQLIRRWGGGHQLSLTARHSLRTGDNSHGALRLDYAFPIVGDLRGHLQWFSGYGESMIDYNHRANYYGVGVSLLEWY